MTWAYTATYFFSYAIVFCIGFYLYGQALLLLGKSGAIIRNLGAFIVYGVFSVFLVSPFFMPFSFLEEWRVIIKDDAVFMFYFGLCYILSIIPGGVYFKVRFLADLRHLGYFQRNQD